MAAPLDAEQIRTMLGLEPHPTCGYVAETYRSPERIAAGDLPEPFADGRPIGTAPSFMVTDDRPVRLHRIRNDQLYHFQLGDPIEVLMFFADGTQGEATVATTWPPATCCTSPCRAAPSTRRDW